MLLWLLLYRQFNNQVTINARISNRKEIQKLLQKNSFPILLYYSVQTIPFCQAYIYSRADELICCWILLFFSFLFSFVQEVTLIDIKKKKNCCLYKSIKYSCLTSNERLTIQAILQPNRNIVYMAKQKAKTGLSSTIYSRTITEKSKDEKR